MIEKTEVKNLALLSLYCEYITIWLTCRTPCGGGGQYCPRSHLGEKNKKRNRKRGKLERKGRRTKITGKIEVKEKKLARKGKRKEKNRLTKGW
jgi:hypothetical protein